jgi:hypothetical protein
MQKFDRVYSLSVEVDNGVNTSPLLYAKKNGEPVNFLANKNVTITLPFTIEFEINRGGAPTAQTATFRIYNLGEVTRNAIQRDTFTFTDFRAIQFRAGYWSPAGNFMPLVFNGTVKTAYSYRRGVDFITEIQAYDGGWQMSNINQVSLTLEAGSTGTETITRISQLMTGLTGAPIVGNYPVANKRGEVLFGNAWQLIQLKSGFTAIIDNGQVKALNRNEVIAGQIPLISSATGLLGSPQRTDATLDFEMIFEPRLTLYQLVRLESSTQPIYNRNWKVMAIQHRGTISPRVGGDALTKVQLFFNDTIFKEIQATFVR